MSDLLRLSVSKTKTFIDCKAKYNFNYNLKLPKKDWDFHILGKFCHKVLEDFHIAYINGCNEPYNKTMSQAFKGALNEYQGKMSKEMRKECWDIIDKYLRIVSEDKKNNLSANVVACEKNFEFNLDNKVTLNGMIDRVQIDADNVVHLADYKTTKNKKYLKDDWFQLLTYAYYFVTHEIPDAEKIRCSYVMLRHDFEYITKEFNKDEILKIKDKYIDYAQQIMSETEFEPNPSPLCSYCDFVASCDAGQKKINMFNGEVEW